MPIPEITNAADGLLEKTQRVSSSDFVMRSALYKFVPTLIPRGKPQTLPRIKAGKATELTPNSLSKILPNRLFPFV